MTEDRAEAPWPRCQAGCAGSALPPWGRCLGHLDPDDLKQAIKRAKTEGLDARGVTVTPPLLERIFSLLESLLEPTAHYACSIPNAQFSQATFTEGVSFVGATFTGEARFDRATFTGEAGFDRATFTGHAWFDRATFTGEARFNQATFTGIARFIEATFKEGAGFTQATFKEGAGFDRATFTREARFVGATFTGEAWFFGATFTGEAEFSQATFTGIAGFTEATFSQFADFFVATFTGEARFLRTTFNGYVWFAEVTEVTGITFNGDADFGRATFTGDVQFDEVSLSGQLGFRWVRAAKRLRLAVRSSNSRSAGKVDLMGASFAGPAVLAASLGGASSQRPKLVSVEQTDTANLTVVGLDLSDCRFLGAINLEQLRIDGPLLLRQAPGWWRSHRLGEEGRQVLWEEGALRGWSGWETPDPPGGLDPSRLQAVYRELRKGREDAKDEPGAADFYYGEMEMRRKAARGVERWLLAGYWTMSGYGLRASRAVLALIVLLAGATVGLHVIGSHPQRGWRDAALYAVYTSTSLLRPAAMVPLTRWGQFIEITLRLLVPVLLGLAVLAIRGRIKR